jgi:hypothetical protein
MDREELEKRDNARDIWQEALDAVRNIEEGRVGQVRHITASYDAEAQSMIAEHERGAADETASIPEWHKAILDERLVAFRRDPTGGITLEEFRRKYLSGSDEGEPDSGHR